MAGINIFFDNHQKLLASLLKNQVEFIVIGGYSVIFHGYMRTTGDMDIWLKPDNQNKEKLKAALKEFGIEKSALAPLDKVDFTEALAFHIDKEPERIDFLTKVNLVSFEEANTMRVISEIDGMSIPFLHLNHLILSKMNTGRTKDMADIEELQKINKLKR